MEDFGAADETPLDHCLSRVKQCDIFLGIVGHFYGSISPTNQCSFTENEYDAANGRPRLMFIAPEGFLLPATLRESDDSWRKQQQFRSRVMAERVVAPFTSPDNLASRVVEALANWRRDASQSKTEQFGEVTHRYEILGEIGGGQSAIVLKAIDLILGACSRNQKAKIWPDRCET
jgi:hypothetical protein